MAFRRRDLLGNVCFENPRNRDHVRRGKMSLRGPSMNQTPRERARNKTIVPVRGMRVIDKMLRPLRFFFLFA